MKSWIYQYKTRYLKLSNGIDLAYVDEGSGDYTLLFIHGLGSNLKAWHKNIETLKHHHRCIAIDLPGYGKSTKADFEFSMSFFAHTILEFVTKLKLNNTCLIGHSMGGQITMTTVLKNKKLIDRLVLIAPAGIEQFAKNESAQLLKTITPTTIQNLSEEQIRYNFEVNFFKMPSDAEFMFEDRMEMRKTDEYFHFSRMIPRCIIGMLNEPVFPKLNQINTPTLIFFGNEDLLIPNRILHPKLTPLKVAKTAQDCIAKSKLIMVPLAGHFTQWEKPKIVNNSILEFLTD